MSFCIFLKRGKNSKNFKQKSKVYDCMGAFFGNMFLVVNQSQNAKLLRVCGRAGTKLKITSVGNSHPEMFILVFWKASSLTKDHWKHLYCRYDTFCRC